MKISTGRAETTEKIRKILRKRGITSHVLSTTSEYIANSTLHGAEETFGCRTSGKLALDDPATIESAAKKPRPSCTAPAHNSTGMVLNTVPIQVQASASEPVDFPISLILPSTNISAQGKITQ